MLAEFKDAAESAEAALTPDFRTLFHTLPSPHMILDRELRYVAVNDAYCEVVERRREELIGRHLFDVFPDPGDGGRRLRESFRHVLETGRRDAIPLIPYPIERPPERGGGFEMRYWSAAHVPLLDEAGRTRFIVQNTFDVTELQRLKAMAYGPGGDPTTGVKDLLLRAREAEAENQSLVRETRGLRDLFMQSPGFMAVLAGEDLRFTLVNNAYQLLIGARAVIGRRIEDALPEVRNQGFVDLLRGVMARREPYIGKSVSVRLRREPEAPLEERFVDFIYQPIIGDDDQVWGIFVEGSDVTDRVLAERRQKLLVDELNHRVKNTLATVQAIADQTLRSAASPEDFRKAFESRLMALSSTHDLLTAGNWESAGLCDVLKAEFRPYPAERLVIDGEDVPLPPAAAVGMGLALHELATNAAKYGALSNAEGRVDVSWTTENGELRLTWREVGGPPVEPPTRRGFGSRLIERSLQGALGGSAEQTFEPDGLVCRLRLPLRETLGA